MNFCDLLFGHEKTLPPASITAEDFALLGKVPTYLGTCTDHLCRRGRAGRWPFDLDFHRAFSRQSVSSVLSYKYPP